MKYCWVQSSPCSLRAFHLIKAGLDHSRQSVQPLHLQRPTHAPDFLQSNQRVQSDTEIVAETPPQHEVQGLLQNELLKERRILQTGSPEQGKPTLLCAH